MFGFFKEFNKKPPENFDSIMVKELNFKSGKATMALSHPEFSSFAYHIIDFFKDAGGINYVSTSFWHPEAGEMEVIVQRQEGKTPAQLKSELQAKYDELLMSVERKFPGENRHETALRYIKEAENKRCGEANKASTRQ